MVDAFFAIDRVPYSAWPWIGRFPSVKFQDWYMNHEESIQAEVRNVLLRQLSRFFRRNATRHAQALHRFRWLQLNSAQFSQP